MIVPSSNLLNTAFNLISKTSFQWYPQSGRTLNEIGVWVSGYAAPITLYGSIQAVSRDVYQALGLDYQKNYISIHVSSPLVDIGRGHSGDKINWKGIDYQLTSEVNWYSIDGWTKVMAIELGLKPLTERIFDETFDRTFA